MLLAVLALAAAYAGFPDAFKPENLIDTVSQWQGHPASPFVFVAVYTPVSIIFPLGVFTVAGGVLFGFWGGFLLSLISVQLGAWLTFRFARRFGPRVAPARVKKTIQRVEPQLSRYGMRVLVFLRLTRFLPGVAVNCAAGMSTLRSREFLIGTFLGVVLWIAGLTFFADTLWELSITARTEGFGPALRAYTPHLAVATLLVIAAVVAVNIRKRRARPVVAK